MKKYSTISEISKLLGLSTDTIRFYEKKGLVHPHVNPENNYRMYTLMNVVIWIFLFQIYMNYQRH